MRSVVINGPGECSIEDVPRPEPTGEEVLIAVDRVQLSVGAYVSHELDGLGSFGEAVEITLDDERTLGPAQMIVS